MKPYSSLPLPLWIYDGQIDGAFFDWRREHSVIEKGKI